MFFGTPGPAAEVLALLLKQKEIEIVGVVTQPDRPKGRGQQLSFSPVKELALKNGLPLEQPEKIRHDQVFKSILESLRPDLGVVVAYGQILPGEILDLPKNGFINLHASLLPKYRGAAPVQWALIKGEKESGMTIFRLTEQLDAGPILSQRAVPIAPEDDAETLLKKVFEVGQRLLLELLPKIAAGKAVLTPQIETECSFAPTLSKESGAIDWRKTAAEIANL
ncbi:MAG: methionyl-tRNA formyltransferase, partial [Candidatus Margulisbacteria bacterium]|nr:methionyl-tRNA formyltransferase [Candidatus Margulisiibacteriota bacterium]